MIPLVDKLRKITWGRETYEGELIPTEIALIPTTLMERELEPIAFRTKDDHNILCALILSFRINNAHQVAYKEPKIYWAVQDLIVDRLRRIVKESRIGPDTTRDYLNKALSSALAQIKFERRGLSDVAGEVIHVELPRELVLEKRSVEHEKEREVEEAREMQQRLYQEKMERENSLSFLQSHLSLLRESMKDEAAIARIISSVMKKRSRTCLEQND